VPGAAGFEPQTWDQLSLALPAALMALANFKQTLQQLINLDLGQVFNSRSGCMDTMQFLCRGRIFSHVRPFCERAVSDLDP
jgi:hypothetical protein